ncbi:UTP--glucose-1-phosphate uridylyltransferase [Trueperella bialowiezensis]|uniref:UTP--glucose-1-phosphate uridylyltransferase n=1 Tax=Trueperella bialowiezensis TaxID=312285 RepID=A0A3S4V008_9ACTO|nr:UTP--glucose-1-phosphate uridylyltransferase [Trueperella bialowiezensis]VEI14010.1 UTP--glucose-1-phosphate uridylyltransferase [Trueperella bialowiezensis]
MGNASGLGEFTEALEANLQKMRADGQSETVRQVFSNYFGQIVRGQTGLIAEETISPLVDIDAVDDSAEREDDVHALGRTVFLKLNGGLGTSMGLDKAKSLLPVRSGKTFLDIMTAQVRDARQRSGSFIPLMFLNSFRTREDTLDVLAADMHGDLPIDLLQNREPKILADTLYPVQWEKNPDLEWCPPGHGDIYTAMFDSGILDDLLAAGYRNLMTSNSDNLGAYPSGRLAAWFEESGSQCSLEVCERSPADRKGGHLAVRNDDGRVILRDRAQTSADDMAHFTDIDRHPYFNTNNMWFNIEALRDLLRTTGGLVDLPVIRNHQTVDPTDPNSPQVIQIECAMGAIVEKFEHAKPIVVGRERFIPVKTTNDLMVIRSDLFTMDERSRLHQVGKKIPYVDLDPRFYKFIADFDRRVRHVPSLLESESLVVRGEWFFDGGHVSGQVELVNDAAEPRHFS